MLAWLLVFSPFLRDQRGESAEDSRWPEVVCRHLRSAAQNHQSPSPHHPNLKPYCKPQPQENRPHPRSSTPKLQTQTRSQTVPVHSAPNHTHTQVKTPKLPKAGYFRHPQGLLLPLSPLGFGLSGSGLANSNSEPGTPTP